MTHPPTVSGVIELPLPVKALWPNGRAHWTVKARETRKHRQWAFVMTKLANDAGLIPPLGDRVNWSVIVHPKTRNVIDRDNAYSSLKSYADGIAQALGVDDKLFNTPSLTFGDPIKGGLVRIEIHP